MSLLDLRHLIRGLWRTPVFTGVAGLLLAVALAATAVPAWRAARTQPMRVLREE